MANQVIVNIDEYQRTLDNTYREAYNAAIDDLVKLSRALPSDSYIRPSGLEDLVEQLKEK